MEKFNFYAANILSEDCEKTASIYSRLFSLEIVCAKKSVDKVTRVPTINPVAEIVFESTSPNGEL
jgi:hypothetical protein